MKCSVETEFMYFLFKVMLLSVEVLTLQAFTIVIIECICKAYNWDNIFEQKPLYHPYLQKRKIIL